MTDRLFLPPYYQIQKKTSIEFAGITPNPCHMKAHIDTVIELFDPTSPNHLDDNRLWSALDDEKRRVGEIGLAAQLVRMFYKDQRRKSGELAMMHLLRGLAILKLFGALKLEKILMLFHDLVEDANERIRKSESGQCSPFLLELKDMGGKQWQLGSVDELQAFITSNFDLKMNDLVGRMTRDLASADRRESAYCAYLQILLLDILTAKVKLFEYLTNCLDTSGLTDIEVKKAFMKGVFQIPFWEKKSWEIKCILVGVLEKLAKSRPQLESELINVLRYFQVQRTLDIEKVERGYAIVQPFPTGMQLLAPSGSPVVTLETTGREECYLRFPFLDQEKASAILRCVYGQSLASWNKMKRFPYFRDAATLWARCADRKKVSAVIIEKIERLVKAYDSALEEIIPDYKRAALVKSAQDNNARIKQAAQDIRVPKSVIQMEYPQGVSRLEDAQTVETIIPVWG